MGTQHLQQLFCFLAIHLGFHLLCTRSFMIYFHLLTFLQRTMMRMELRSVTIQVSMITAFVISCKHTQKGAFLQRIHQTDHAQYTLLAWHQVRTLGENFIFVFACCHVKNTCWALITTI
ncbi:unnamed protein product [Albugo candida]|uniref:Uncharacterized protein n=1 Tax=Albugo candida TaxID=65357 RepID=A0A024G9Q6_9STRA|nr:unnamed protein product [Albugo candida]|eukprot:CCI43062.1 unnamed protein product [Albugo candida]